MMEGSLQKQLDETEILEEMPFTEWLKMFSANHSAVIGLVILIFVISLSLIGPLFYKTDPFEMVWAPFSPPGEEGFFLGTDYLGRDLLAQIIHGGRASLIVGCSRVIECIDWNYTRGTSRFLQRMGRRSIDEDYRIFQVLPTLLFLWYWWLFSALHYL